MKQIHRLEHFFSDKDGIGPLSTFDELSARYSNTDLILIIDNVWEARSIEGFDRVKKLTTLIHERHPQWKVFLTLNYVDRDYEKLYRESLAIDDILFVDYFAYRVYKEIVLKNRSDVCTHYGRANFNRHKFLFLTGLPGKWNRARLLKKIIEAGLIKYCNWSLLYPRYDQQALSAVASVLPELTESEIVEFLKKWARLADKDINLLSNGFKFDPIEYNMEYDVKIYRSSDFSVIAESNYTLGGPPWITEKTWKTIVNEHPFIMAGNKGVLAELRHLGFNTFEHLVLHKEYDSIIDLDQRLDAIVGNAQHWLNNLHNHCDEVNYLVDDNKKKLRLLYYKNHEKILEFIQTNNLEITVDELIPTADRGLSGQYQTDNNFVLFYNNIRDDSWPECNTEDDFFNLPIHIQNECINVFGYIPKTQNGS